MKFDKQFMQDIVYGESEVAKKIEEEIIDTSRWSIHYSMIFEFEGKCYESFYTKGATEQQDEQPYEYEHDEIECQEVHQVTKEVKVWEPIND